MRHVRERACSSSGGRCLLTCPPFLLGRAFYRSQDVCGLHRRARHSVGYVRHTEHVGSAGLLVTSSKESRSSPFASTDAGRGPERCSSTAFSNSPFRPPLARTVRSSPACTPTAAPCQCHRRTSECGARAWPVRSSTALGARQADQDPFALRASIQHSDGEPFSGKRSPRWPERQAVQPGR